MNNISNIIDKPLNAGGADLLGTDKYMKALIQFISNANMPTTVAIQGEWGSGKTSMMNQLEYQLCESEKDKDKDFYGVWINTWQYSLMKSPEETLVNIISGLTSEVLSITKNKHESSAADLTKKVGDLLNVVARAAAKTAINSTGMPGGEIVDSLLKGEKADTAIIGLRNTLEDAIEKCLEADEKSGKPKKGFIFFVDDLDRIDPPIAVQVLELIKNIFEVDNCIFILAIDYEVVVKGLEPKFGKLTEKNEREFRSFFDKIIQLPFSMPVASYKIDRFLIDKLSEIRYIDETLLQDENFKQLLTEMATRSVGTNPRGIKRLINTLSLIQIMNELDLVEGDLGQKRHEKLLNFGFVCIQIAFPSFYSLVVEEPNFKDWDEKLANRLRLKKLSDEQIEQLKDLEEFDEEWEMVVFRACINDAYLAARAFDISILLNLIKDLVPKDMPFEEEIQKVLTLSSVTSVSLDKKSAKAKGTRDIKGSLEELKNDYRDHLSDDCWAILDKVNNYIDPVVRENDELSKRHSKTHPISVFVDKGKYFSVSRANKKQLKLCVDFKGESIDEKKSSFKKILESFNIKEGELTEYPRGFELLSKFKSDEIISLYEELDKIIRNSH